jgi:hypothetical protein
MILEVIKPNETMTALRWNRACKIDRGVINEDFPCLS